MAEKQTLYQMVRSDAPEIRSLKPRLDRGEARALSFSKECQRLWLYLPMNNHHASIPVQGIAKNDLPPPGSRTLKDKRQQSPRKVPINEKLHRACCQEVCECGFEWTIACWGIFDRKQGKHCSDTCVCKEVCECGFISVSSACPCLCSSA